MNNLTDIKSMTLDELTDFVTENGFPKFRAKQIYDWLYKNVTDFDDMRNISADLKTFLKSSCYISVANIEKNLFQGMIKQSSTFFRLMTANA